jgi:hypothetical protein
MENVELVRMPVREPPGMRESDGEAEKEMEEKEQKCALGLFCPVERFVLVFFSFQDSLFYP